MVFVQDWVVFMHEYIASFERNGRWPKHGNAFVEGSFLLACASRCIVQEWISFMQDWMVFVQAWKVFMQEHIASFEKRTGGGHNTAVCFLRKI